MSTKRFHSGPNAFGTANDYCRIVAAESEFPALRSNASAYEAREACLARIAESEARRILADAETGDRSDIEYVRIPETRYFKRKARKDAETRSLFGPYLDAHAALAETLRAFVSSSALTPDTEGV